MGELLVGEIPHEPVSAACRHVVDPYAAEFYATGSFYIVKFDARRAPPHSSERPAFRRKFDPLTVLEASSEFDSEEASEGVKDHHAVRLDAVAQVLMAVPVGSRCLHDVGRGAGESPCRPGQGLLGFPVAHPKHGSPCRRFDNTPGSLCGLCVDVFGSTWFPAPVQAMTHEAAKDSGTQAPAELLGPDDLVPGENLLDADTQEGGVVVPAAPSIGEIDDKMLGRVDRMQEAYAAGELDDKLIAKAARAIGISEEEARRRLATRVSVPSRSSVPRSDRRKKAKQAKASRRKNR